MNSVVTTYTGTVNEASAVSGVRNETKTSRAPKDERELVARLRRGDAAAFDQLVNTHHGALIRMAMGHVADREVAEEVVQDTWMAVIESLDRFEGRSSLKTWIFGILIHKAKDRGVREKRQAAFSSFESHEDESDEAVDPSRFHRVGELVGRWAFPPQPWDGQTPERLLASKQATDCLQQAIADLPLTLREVFVLRDVEGVESKEICGLLKITDTNLYVRLHRARERVRRTLEQHFENK
jgi:RNA polymerase sigma-70 factor (ECF subfamily)